MTAPAIRYPTGPITPHGAYELLRGNIPLFYLTAHDGSIRFEMMGGLSMTDHTRPECVLIKRDGLKGLVPPWKIIQQKGATQDGITFVDALGEPIEVQINAVARARNGHHLRRVVRHLTGAIDPKKTAELGFITQELGHWWAEVRWLKTIPGALSGARQHRQDVDLMLQADHGFWQTDPDVDSFDFTYSAMTETFADDHEDDLGPHWPLYYYDGDGGGHPYTTGGEARWLDDPDDPITTEGRSVMFGPFEDFETDTNNQVVSIELGSFQEITFPDGAENHIWARVGRNPDGTWDGSGVRASIGLLAVELSYFVDFTETRMRLWPKPIPAFPRETYTLVAGFDGNERKFQIQRNGLGIWNHTEAEDGGSPLGPDNRGISAGMRAGGALITQATPASIRKIKAGDNATISQSGFLERVNVGDQPMYDDYTVFGPGLFKFWNGPGAEDWVEFGPLLPNQVMFIRTDPRDRSVQDMTQVPPTPQELTQFQSALDKFLSLVGVSGTPLGQELESRFGILPPQGNPFSLLKGRFSDAAAIPPKSPGEPVRTHHVKVSIEGGDASSKIVVSGTPMRRLPF